jgi:ABC-type transporter Mla MlaB component
VAAYGRQQTDPMSTDESDLAIAIRPGEHACCRFVRAQDRLRAAKTFVHEGLRRGDKVVYLLDADDMDGLVSELAGESDRVRPAIESGQLEVRPARGAYLPDGSFDVERTLQTMREEHDRARAEGYPALSITGETSWVLHLPPGHEQLAEYEHRFGDVVEGREIVALCQYGYGHFDTATQVDLATAHEVDLSPELAALAQTGCLAGARIDDGQTLRLAGELDFACADALVSLLDAHFHGPLQVDLADLSYVDVTGMRALRGRTGQRLRIAAASGAVRQLLTLLAWDTDPAVELVW